MDKEQILEEISKAEKHIANMKKMLGKREYERWKPEINELYYYINQIGEVVQNRNDNTDIDIERYNFYNCFKTREQAKAEVEKILVGHQIEDVARRLNKGVKIDWEDSRQRKYSIIFNARDRKFICDCNRYAIISSIYCLDENFLDVALEEIGKERLAKYFERGRE